MQLISHEITFLDIFAPIWFLCLWAGYSFMSDYRSKKRDNLVQVMYKYRLQWMKQMIKREDRLVDVRVIGNLLRSTTFFASTSIILTAGLVAVLGYGQKALPILNSLPFTAGTSMTMWIVKSGLMIVIFIYSFFKFTWVTRQFNYATVVILSAPMHKEGTKNRDMIKKETRYVVKAATLLSNAAKHFNMGIRSYYFGLVALGWFISPLLLIVLSVFVVIILYRREYMSKTLLLLLK